MQLTNEEQVELNRLYEKMQERLKEDNGIWPEASDEDKTMLETRRKALEKAGFKVGTVQEFLGLSDSETKAIEDKLKFGDLGQSSTDCRSEEGITVGLIDSLISIARVLAHRDLTPNSVVEALKDLAQDEDMKTIMDAGYTPPTS